LVALTSAQTAFATAHNAVPGHAAATGSGIFVYREGHRVTKRWLVDPEGTILDVRSFPGSPARA